MTEQISDELAAVDALRGLDLDGVLAHCSLSHFLRPISFCPSRTATRSPARKAESNPALTISPKTVAAHVEHILTKLGFSRRAQIATWTATH